MGTSAVRVMWTAVVAGLVAAAAYVLIGLGALSVGEISAAEAPAGITFVAASGYLVGAGMILVRRRWLWAVGAALNAMVVTFFLLGYQDRPDVLMSPGGLVTKTSQVLLETCLLYLVVAARSRQPRQHLPVTAQAQT